MKPFAMFTITQDEIDLLPVWLRWHQKYAPDADFYILNHDSRGDAAEYLASLPSNITVLDVHYEVSFDYGWLAGTVNRFMEFLLQSYEIVAFSEVDELLFPWRRELPTLRAAFGNQDMFVRADGMCLVHHYPEEPDMDWSKPILSQRKHYYRSARYSKVCMAKLPVYWNPGFHTCDNVPEHLQASMDLMCLHLHQADYRTTLRRHQRNAGRLWSPEFRLSPLALHQRLDNPEELQRYLLCNLDRPEEYAKLYPILPPLKERECDPA